MTFSSSFGSNLPPTGFDAPSKHHGHNVLHNLLSDAIDTAKGIPFGTLQAIEHPITAAKLIGQSYADTYGHGWHHFEASFMAHPLQPLLDAISIPLLFVGGLGAGIKGASAVAEIGRTAESAALIARASELAAKGEFTEADALRASAMRHPGLDAAAQRFRKGTSATTRMYKVPDMPGVSLPKAYSSNLFRRAMTKGSDALLEGLGNKVPGSYFSTEGVGRRLLAKEVSKRAAATAAASKGQAAVLIGAKKAGLSPQEVIDALGERFKASLTENAIKVDAKYAKELANSPLFRGRDAKFEFIYEKPAEMVDAQIIDPSEFTHAPLGPDRQLPPGGEVAKMGTENDRYDTKIHMREGGPHERPQTLGSFEHSDMLNAIKTMAQQVETGGRHERALVEDGKVLVVRKGVGEAMVHDLEGSAKLANLIYRAPLTAWKGFILGLSPRYFVNNVIGNAGMYAAATNPVEFSRGILEATKAVRGIRAASKLQKGMEVTVDQLMRKWMPDEWVHSRFGYLQHGALGVDQTAGVRLKGSLKRAGHAKLYALTEQVAYRGPQRASLMGALHTDADFRNLYRHKVAGGMERGRAYREAANTIISDPRKSAAFEKRVTDWAGQYYHLNSLEKKLTAFVPFYTWDRHALRFGKEQVLSRPVRSIVLSQLGAIGDKEAAKELGKVPDFMKGAIPVSGKTGGILGLLLGQNLRGRKKILLTAGYNPLAAAADDADAIAALFGQGPRSAGEAVGGQLNPVISGAIAGITGQNIFSGAKAETYGLGPVGGAAHETAAVLPHFKLAQAGVKKLLGESTAPKTTTSKGTPTLYTHDMRQTISSLLGLNERDFSPAAAKRLYDEQHHIKKGRRHARKAAYTLKSSLKSNF